MDIRTEIRRLTAAELTVVAAAVLLFVDSFLPWFRYCVSIEILGLDKCASTSAWDGALSLLAVLVAAAMAAQILAVRFGGVQMAAPGTLTWGQLQMAAGAVVLGLVVLQLIIGKSPGQRWIGLYAALVLAAALLYGALRQRSTPEPVAPPPGQLDQS